MTTILTFVLFVALAAGWAVTARLAVLWWRRLHTDRLTGLPNRDALTRAFARATRRGFAVGLLLIDLDKFKAVNDTYGHEAGNQLLRAVARQLGYACAFVGTGALPVRLHGDEFAVLLPDLPPGQGGLEAAQRCGSQVAAAIGCAVVERPEHTLRASASVGTAVAATWSADLPLLMRVADQRMYAAKKTETFAGRWSA